MIISAKLYLYCTYASPTSNVTVNVHKTGDNWNEYTITWNNPPTPPVGDLVEANTKVGGASKFYSWTVTSYAQSEYNGDKILSLVVKFPVDDPEHPEQNPSYHRDFASKETYTSSRRPYLEICYTTPTLSVSIAPTSVVMDVGQSQLFTSSVSGGTAPYTYHWYLNGTPVGANANWTFTPTSPGSYEVYLNVTDGVGATAKSNVASVTVNPTLTVSISPAVVVMDVDQSVTFNSSVSGGTPPYAYQWYLDGAPVGTGSTWTFSPASPGTYEVYLNVTDGVGVIAQSNIASVTVNPALTVSISPTSVVMDVGQFVTFNSSVSGGTLPYAYQWYLDGAPVGTNPTWTFSPASPGSYEVYLNVTDDVGVTAKSNIASVTVNPALSVSISPTTVTMDVGQSQLFNSSVSGGTSPYTYQWYLNGTPVGTNPTWTFTPTSPGFYVIYVNVTDYVGATAKSNIASVTVNPTLAVSISPSVVVMDVGQSQLFNSSVSGGTPPYTYQWYLDGAPVGTNPTWTFSPASPGSYEVYLNVTDNVGVTVQSNIASVMVNPTLSVIINPTSVVMDVGQSVTFNSSVSGGTLPYTYQWYLDDSPVSGATNPTWTFTPTSSGSYEVYLNVTDDVGVTAKSNIAYVTVNPKLSVSISPISATMNLGDSKTFTSSVSGGTLPYTYQWYLNDAPVSGANASTWVFTPTSTGSYTVYLNVTDSVGVTAQSNLASVIVNPPLEVSISPTSFVMDVGQSLTFTSSVSGGTPPFTYQWYLNDAPVPSATNPTWAFIPTSPGIYEVYLIVADSSDPAQSNRSGGIVNPPPTVSISPPSVVMDVGQSQLFNSSVSGGTSPYTYQWYLNGTPVGTNPTWTFIPTSPGLYEVYLNVTDSVNVTVKSNVASVTVNPPPEVSIIPMSVTMDVGESQLFASIVSGGTPPYTYQWYLNGTVVLGATSSSWTFIPTSPGYYLVHVRVTDYVGVSDESDRASVTVRGRPKAAFTYSPPYPYVNETVTFDASASTPNGGVISNYTWNFGDGNITTVTDLIITHVYEAERDYNVTLTVMDSEGFSDSTSEIITVYLPLLYSMDHTAHYLSEEFLINVVVVNVTNLYSFEFKLGYNTTLLDAISVTEGPFLKGFGSTSATMEIHDPEGYVWVRVTLLAPAPPAEGNGILATIRFKVTYATVYPETTGCTLDLYDTELKNPLGQPIPHEVYDGRYEFVPLRCSGPWIDVYTQKPDPYSGKGLHQPSDAFAPQEEVILYAEVHYNCEPVENKLVAFEIKYPNGTIAFYRSAATNEEGIARVSFRMPWPCPDPEKKIFGMWNVTASVDIAETTVSDSVTFVVGWIVEILSVETVDSIGQLKSSFEKGEQIHFNLTIQNIAFVSKTATLTIVVYDECGVSIGLVTLPNWVIGSGSTETFIIDLLIPSWSFIGAGRIYANAYTKLPSLGGVPYCPEESTTFMIVTA